MKRAFAAICLGSLLVAGRSFAGVDGAWSDAGKLFIEADAYYQSRDYAKAAEKYEAIVAAGKASGNLYYNIGNTYLKLGKTGLAILYYEKARRLIPGDSDLKSNLAYARSLAPGAVYMSVEPGWYRSIKSLLRNLNLNTIIGITASLYLVAIVLLSAWLIFIAYRRIIRPYAAIASICTLFLFALTAVRYYDERVLAHGIVVEKEVECKYEPIDKSTTFYTLGEGDDVLIVRKINGWMQIRRSDGRIAWMKAEAAKRI